jgi:hypothetical protein
MEQLEQEPSQQFIKGFNAGYQLSKYESQLLDKILKSNNEQNEFVNALNLGSKQYQKEKFIQKHSKIIESQKQNIRPK